MQYKHQDIFVEADKERIIQVISNLLNNAIKFTQVGGTISISLQKKDDEDDNNSHIVISLKDTGSGIDPEILPKLFTKFASKSYQGTGLGLFISKSIIEAHGGTVRVKSTPFLDDRKRQRVYEGFETTFTVILPIAR